MQDKSIKEDTIQKLEKIITDLLLYVYRFCSTPVVFILMPRRFQFYINYVLNPNSHAKAINKYLPPTIYLLTASAICTIYGYLTSKSPMGSKLLLASPLFSPFKLFLSHVAETCKEMKFNNVIYLMMPIILMTALLSFSFFFTSKIFKIRTRFKTIFLINSYTIGTYLLLHGLLFAYSMLLAGLQTKLLVGTLSILLLILHIIIGILILIVAFRHLQLISFNFNITKLKAGSIIANSLLFFILFFVPIIVLVFPILPDVWR